MKQLSHSRRPPPRNAPTTLANLLARGTARLKRARLSYGQGTELPIDDAAALLAHAQGLTRPLEERDLARKKKMSTFTNELENNIDFITEQCVSANNAEQVDCMIKAKTADEVAKCADPAGSD
jgi:hypothetical protein